MTFDPRSYPESNVQCKAIDRSDADNEKEVEININYIEINPGAKANGTLVMVHGWPAIWSTWARQIEEFKDRYHLLIPNLRGFGKSGHPGDVHSSGTYEDFVSDVICILDAAKVDKAICIGHDWGAQICFEAARQRPDRVKAVIAAVVPYLPAAGPFVPTEYLARLAPKLAYQTFFCAQTEAAAAELNKDIRRTLRCIIRSKDNLAPDSFLLSTETMLGAFEGIEPDPILYFTPLEEDYLVEQFGIQGFGKTLQFYLDGNRKRSHAFVNAQGNFIVDVPVLMILPTRDSVADWKMAMKMIGSEKFVPRMTTVDMETSHWPQLEKPEEFNDHIKAFLKTLDELPANPGPDRAEC